jgi:predicted nuclease of predicted toxin-antitoxin system
MIYFIDRSLPKISLVKALERKGCNVKHHDTIFPQDASDVEWLTEAGKNQWIVLTHDKRIAMNPLEIKSLRRANIKAFVLASKGSLNGEEIVNIVIEALSSIERFAKKNKPPFIAKVYRGGKVKKWK